MVEGESMFYSVKDANEVIIEFMKSLKDNT